MNVAVAVIFDDQHRVLITQRPAHVAHGGMWEFPGGKLEPLELAHAALIREINEEVGVDILNYCYIGRVSHNYGTKIVNLLVFSVDKYQGEAYCRESQTDLRWVPRDELALYSFPEANKRVIELIQEKTKQLLASD
jgi:8-oxo-dGTP diphosphatase